MRPRHRSTVFWVLSLFIIIGVAQSVLAQFSRQVLTLRILSTSAGDEIAIYCVKPSDERVLVAFEGDGFDPRGCKFLELRPRSIEGGEAFFSTRSA
jgi:hypothetical protein